MKKLLKKLRNRGITSPNDLQYFGELAPGWILARHIPGYALYYVDPGSWILRNSITCQEVIWLDPQEIAESLRELDFASAVDLAIAAHSCGYVPANGSIEDWIIDRVSQITSNPPLPTPDDLVARILT